MFAFIAGKRAEHIFGGKGVLGFVVHHVTGPVFT
jgi:hypothetical protein